MISKEIKNVWVKDRPPKKRKDTKGIYREVDEETVDGIVKSRIEAWKKGSGKGKKWPDEDLIVRRQAILTLLRNGYSRSRIVEELTRRWEITETTAKTYIKDAILALGATNADFMDHVREVETERLEVMLEEAIKSGDRRTALSCLEMLNKIGGLYGGKIGVDMQVAGDMRFDFGTKE